MNALDVLNTYHARLFVHSKGKQGRFHSSAVTFLTNCWDFFSTEEIWKHPRCCRKADYHLCCGVFMTRPNALTLLTKHPRYDQTIMSTLHHLDTSPKPHLTWRRVKTRSSHFRTVLNKKLVAMTLKLYDEQPRFFSTIRDRCTNFERERTMLINFFHKTADYWIGELEKKSLNLKQNKQKSKCF